MSSERGVGRSLSEEENPQGPCGFCQRYEGLDLAAHALAVHSIFIKLRLCYKVAASKPDRSVQFPRHYFLFF